MNILIPMLFLALTLIGISSTLKCDRCFRAEKCSVKECPETGKFGPFLCVNFGKRENKKGKGCILKRLMNKALSSGDDTCGEVNGIAILLLLLVEGDFGLNYTTHGDNTHPDEWDILLLELVEQLGKTEAEKEEVRATFYSAQFLTEEQWLGTVEQKLEELLQDRNLNSLGRSSVQFHLKRYTMYPACSCSQDSCNNYDWIDSQNGQNQFMAGGRKSKVSNNLMAPGVIFIFLAITGIVVRFGF